jgi:hypothetical protein
MTFTPPSDFSPTEIRKPLLAEGLSFITMQAIVKRQLSQDQPCIAGPRCRRRDPHVFAGAESRRPLSPLPGRGAGAGPRAPQLQAFPYRNGAGTRPGSRPCWQLRGTEAWQPRHFAGALSSERAVRSRLAGNLPSRGPMVHLSIQTRSTSGSAAPSWLRPLAQAGLIAKGITYCLLGTFAFMAAFHIGNRSGANADRSGVFSFLEDAPAGPFLLGALALGLLCYTAWRLFEAVADPGHKGSGAKGIANRLRYALSGFVYASIAWVAARAALTHHNSSSDSKQKAAHELLSRPAGQWLTGIAALTLVGIGLYQVWYGWSEKYRKHVPGATLQKAGKVGYSARGIVWCVLGWLFEERPSTPIPPRLATPARHLSLSAAAPAGAPGCWRHSASASCAMAYSILSGRSMTGSEPVPGPPQEGLGSDRRPAGHDPASTPQHRLCDPGRLCAGLPAYFSLNADFFQLQRRKIAITDP